MKPHDYKMTPSEAGLVKAVRDYAKANIRTSWRSIYYRWTNLDILDQLIQHNLTTASASIAHFQTIVDSQSEI